MEVKKLRVKIENLADEQLVNNMNKQPPTIFLNDMWTRLKKQNYLPVWWANLINLMH
jgi:hypothetical protein